MIETDTEAVRLANEAFYAAFEARDLDAMAALWERSERAMVTHPGWPTLRGWPNVVGSWDAIFGNTPYIQFFLTDERIDVVGDVAWVTVSEGILQSTPMDEDSPHADSTSAGTVAATNVFVRDGDDWRMVLHHGSPVAGPHE